MEPEYFTLPTLFRPVGAVLVRQGVKLVVVKRPADLKIKDACRDCFFSDKSCSWSNNHLQCSKFDRRDQQSVWFVKVDTNQ